MVVSHGLPSAVPSETGLTMDCQLDQENISEKIVTFSDDFSILKEVNYDRVEECRREDPRGGLSKALASSNLSQKMEVQAKNECVKSLVPGTKEMQQLFMLPQGSRYFNASYGTVPRPVMHAQWALQVECETDPQEWMLGGAVAHLRPVRERLSHHLACNVRDLVLVENCTSAVNAVLRSIEVKPGDALVHLSTAYGVIKNCMKHVAARCQARVVEVPVEWLGGASAPCGTGGEPLEESVARCLSQIQEGGGRVALACFDHIASCPGVKMPVEGLVRACSARGVAVMLDGAHVLGQLQVDLTHLASLGLTYWASDAHKWLFSPKGTAVLWVAPHAQARVVPAALGAVVCSSTSSSSFRPETVAGLSDFELRFQYTGTRDYTPFAAIAAALDFRARIGEREILEYNNRMAVWTQNYLASLWGTEVLVPESNTCAMAHVRLPVNTKAAADALMRMLKAQHNIRVMHFTVPPPSPSSPLPPGVTRRSRRRAGPTFWIRPCMQVFVTREDVEVLGDAVAELAPLAAVAEAGEKWARKVRPYKSCCGGDLRRETLTRDTIIPQVGSFGCQFGTMANSLDNSAGDNILTMSTACSLDSLDSHFFGSDSEYLARTPSSRRVSRNAQYLESIGKDLVGSPWVSSPVSVLMRCQGSWASMCSIEPEVEDECTTTFLAIDENH